jgi:hypothetical protein
MGKYREFTDIQMLAKKVLDSVEEEKILRLQREKKLFDLIKYLRAKDKRFRMLAKGWLYVP